MTYAAPLADMRFVLDEVAGQRLRVLKALQVDSTPRYVLTTIQALIQPVPDREQLTQGKRVLSTGEAVDLDELSGWLLDHGYRRTDAFSPFPVEGLAEALGCERTPMALIVGTHI